MKKLFKIFTLVLLLSFTLILVGCKQKSDVQGEVTIVVVDGDKKELFNEKVSFKEGDTYVTLLEANEKTKMKGSTSEYGYFIESLCGIVSSKDNHTFWAIYVNNESSIVGISQIPLKDKDIIKFALETW